MNLSTLQRIKRRWALLGGSYTHPDGTFELDFDAAAGIDPTVDSTEVQHKKLAEYSARQRSWQKKVGAGCVGIAGYLMAARIGAPTGEAIMVGALIGYGLILRND